MRPAKGKGLLRRTQRAALLREPCRYFDLERRRVPAHNVDAARRIPVRYAKAAAPRQGAKLSWHVFGNLGGIIRRALWTYLEIPVAVVVAVAVAVAVDEYNILIITRMLRLILLERSWSLSKRSKSAPAGLWSFLGTS